MKGTKERREGRENGEAKAKQGTNEEMGMKQTRKQGEGMERKLWIGRKKGTQEGRKFR